MSIGTTTGKKAVGYMRTSSATNVGDNKDSEKRQRVAIEAFAADNGYEIGDDDWFYDAAVKGVDAIADRLGFNGMLDRLAGNGVRTIIVESPDRFARDLIVQLTGHDHLKKLGITLIPASCPDHFLQDTPTAILIRQVLGAIAQFEKANLVAKLKVARDRKKLETGKCGGRKRYAELNPELVDLARSLRRRKPRPSLRKISAELAAAGYTNRHGLPYSASGVLSMLR
jgi:DNA invertase Pin-like site-specific DNA recombinase